MRKMQKKKNNNVKMCESHNFKPLKTSLIKQVEVYLIGELEKFKDLKEECEK